MYERVIMGVKASLGMLKAGAACYVVVVVFVRCLVL
jgi:hypothetical protein